MGKHSTSGVERKHFNDKLGIDAIRRANMFPNKMSAIEVELREKYYALASANALIKYLEKVQTALAPAARSLQISFLPSPEDICHIDTITARELELVRSSSSAPSDANKYTLFDVINYTCTAAGRRALKWRLLQPFRKSEDIEEQLNNVGELINNPDALEDLRNLLSKSTDLEKIVSGLNLAATTQTDRTSALASRVQNLLALKFNLNLLESFETVLDSLNDAECTYLKSIHQFLLDSRLMEISYEINRYLIPEATLSRGVLDSLNIRMQCVRTGISHTLDEYRKLYGELIRDAEAACKDVAANHQLPVKLTYNAARGFHLTLSRKGFSAAQLPTTLLKITTEQATYHFTTEILLQVNERMEYLLDVIYDKTMVVLTPLLQSIEPYTECLYKMAEILSELDVACSLAVVATCGHGFVRPKLSDSATVVEESRHPVYTRYGTSEDHEDFQCNPIYFSRNDNVIVLSGPNNSGKSVYMKQVALMQILAQIGSYVPAKWAVFRPAGSIISRTGHGDDLQSNASTFMMEVLRIGQMIRHVEEDSLLIIDELGRGTSEEDGSALSFAVGEYLCGFTSFVIFSTHFELVMHLERFFPNVSNYHMDAEFGENGNLVYKHTLEFGIGPLSSCGVPVALNNGLSEEVCARATEIAQEIWLDSRPSRTLDENEIRLKLRRKASQLRRKLFILSKGRNSVIDTLHIDENFISVSKRKA
ncbi:mutS protein homolog 4 [Galendromus occidentalis]|uniref:MutS protein homolog 4 n=1 Tax=Galendromus occidentalis TaxID=34638 RepID=A0AAJ6QQ47_9ACAR|nr:mutS protein homolog 4 [Galendromus occidentalis]